MTSPSETIAKAMEGVTPGEWKNIGRLGENGQYTIKSDPYYVAEITGFQENEQATADYIAACSPHRMRFVLDELYALRETALKLEAMQREMAKLREALRPFAEHQTADGLIDLDGLLRLPDGHPLLFNGLGDDLRVTVTIGDVRRARTLIQGEKP